MSSNQAVADLLKAINKLSIYNIFSINPGSSITGLLGSDKECIPAGIFRELALWTETSGIPPAGNLWQNFILDHIILSDNTFTRYMSGGASPESPLENLITESAREDLLGLKEIADVDFSLLFPQDCSSTLKLLNKPLSLLKVQDSLNTPGQRIFQLKKMLLDLSDWSKATEALKEFHRREGCGQFCRFYAFRWDGPQKGLSGIPDPDPVRMDSLIGYVDERSQVIQNTERLLSGLPAGNMLLYGDRGTGKSSTVKALLHSFGPHGLRIIEIPRNYLADYYNIIHLIRPSGLSFILFIDDLSYEESETDYKLLKSILDGSLQARPENVAIYATSNRRHLVRERFDDRQGDVHGSDTLQEKLSLSERFAVTVLFLSPDQELYLDIAEKLARQRGIVMSPVELRLRALEWEKWNNGRSGRTARQFVDSLIT